jgi:1-acyl-sn-glycerol-3-phosphate acyltransferase
MKPSINLYGPIPHPEFTSYMHERMDIPREKLADRMQRYRRQPTQVIAWEAVLSRLIIKLGIAKGVGKYVLFHLVMRVFRFYFRAFNNLQIHGVENIPKQGCIFYINHIGSLDPFIILAAVPNTIISAFAAWGNGWFSDLVEEYYGIASLRRYKKEQAIEYLIRLLLLKNRYIMFSPEAHPHPGPIQQGYSMIVPVYAAINHDRDRIPFVPILLRGPGAMRYGAHHAWGRAEIYFLEPVYLNRTWLKPPEEGGKSQREIVDYLMMILARKNGQKALDVNPMLEASRRYNENKEKYEAQLQEFTTDVRSGSETCEACKVVNAPKQAVKAAAGPAMELLVIDPTGVHQIVRCSACGACYNVATREGKTWVTRLQGLEGVRWAIMHVMIEHGGSLKAAESNTAQ